MHPREWSEIAPFVELMDETVASLVVDHSNERLRVTADVKGIPNIADLLSKLIAAEQGRHRRSASAWPGHSCQESVAMAMTALTAARN